MSEFTEMLNCVDTREIGAPEALLELVYDELRKLACSRMARERADHTLQPTALVHEAWLRLSAGENTGWKRRGHFFAAAAEAMRRVLIDRARSKNSQRRGGRVTKVDLSGIDVVDKVDDSLLLRVHEALERLEMEDAKAAQVVSLRFFAGLSMEEIALAMNISDRTARRYWRFARVWLFDAIRRDA